jgi:hypothetical protein
MGNNSSKDKTTSIEEIDKKIEEIKKKCDFNFNIYSISIEKKISSNTTSNTTNFELLNELLKEKNKQKLILKKIEEYKLSLDNIKNNIYSQLKNNLKESEDLNKYNDYLNILIKKRLFFRYNILFLILKILLINFTIKLNLDLLGKELITILKEPKLKQNEETFITDLINQIKTIDIDIEKINDNNESNQKLTSILSRTQDLFTKYNNETKKNIKMNTSAISTIIQGGGEEPINSKALFLSAYEKDLNLYKEYKEFSIKFLTELIKIIENYYIIYISLIEESKKKSKDFSLILNKFNSLNDIFKNSSLTEISKPTILSTLTEYLTTINGVIKETKINNNDVTKALVSLEELSKTISR